MAQRLPEGQDRPGLLWASSVAFYLLPVTLALAAGVWSPRPLRAAILLFCLVEVATGVICALTSVGWGGEWRRNLAYFLRWSALNFAVIASTVAVAEVVWR